jgi:2-aminoadipate transaminase
MREDDSMTASSNIQKTAALHERLARRSPAFQHSVWETVDRLVAGAGPETIYFGNGTPSRELIPFDEMQVANQRAWDDIRETPGALDYGDAPGYPPLRDLIGRRMAHVGVTADRSNILLTNGSQQAIDYLCRLMLDAGDSIVVEGPTYLGALQVFDAYEVEYITIPVDDHGLDVDLLRERLIGMSTMPKLIYTIPTFQNPTGVTMPLDRRQALVNLARESGILILEDDPYGELWVDEPPPPALRSLDDQVAYLGTFSKTIAPGIRSGWVVTPPGFMEMLTIMKEVSDIHGERVMMRTVTHAVEDFLDGHLVKARAVYRTRRDAMLAGLEHHMPPGTTWSHPGGGFFIWVTLPEGLDAIELLPKAVDHGVAYLAGEWFYPGYQELSAKRNLRLNFSTLPAERIEEGLRRLGAVLRSAPGKRVAG